MNLEDKFIDVLTRSTEPCVMYLQSTNGDFIKLEYRKRWDDGLGIKSQVRIINPKLGISNAPASWDHLLRSLKVNDVEESEFNRVLDRRVDMQILHNYRSLDTMKKVFGDEYVDDVIDKRGKRSFADDIKDLYNSLVKRKPKPGLTLVKGATKE